MDRALDLLNSQAAATIVPYLCEARIPGASVTVVADDLAYHYTYGVKSVVTAEPVTPETSFGIGSCSKAFVSATVASLVADGLVSWDDPISKFVPEFKLYDPAITAEATLRDLGGNRLGIPRAGLVEFGLNANFPPEENFDRLQYTQPIAPFRTRMTYVNPAHVANGVAIGRITGKGFLQTLKDRILVPLGMTGTSGGARVLDDLTDLAGWHSRIDGEIVEIPPLYRDLDLGSSGMAVNGRDAAKWLRLHLNGGLVDGQQVIARDALLETHRPQIVFNNGDGPFSLRQPKAHIGAYALGWAVSDLDGVPLVSHSGSDLGVASMTLLFPTRKLGIAVYVNLPNEGVVLSSYALAGCLLGLPPRDWATHFGLYTPPSAPSVPPSPPFRIDDLTPYLGTYRHPGDGPVVIGMAGDALFGDFTDGQKMKFSLTAVGEDRFELDFVDPSTKMYSATRKPTLQFTRDDSGMASVAIAVMPGQERVFDRV